MELKTEYQYIRFVQTAMLPKTSVWSCRNIHHGEELGVIRWYPAWRQYCYTSIAQVVYSKGCLSDIQEFLQALAEQRSQQSTRTK